jgi:hypothetical protein
VRKALLSQSNTLTRILAHAQMMRRHKSRRVASDRPPAPFIVGSPRSGTTLLRLMLDSHPRLAIPPETGFLPRTLFAFAGSEEHRRRAFVDALVNFPSGAPAWQDFGIESRTLLAELRKITPFTVDEGLRCFYRLYAARFGKPRWGDKTPTYGRHLRAIERVLPEACFIHLIRDGRDVALSLRNLWFSPGTDMGTLAGQWCRDVTASRRESLRCRRYLELRYEALVLQPEQTLKRVCAFIEIDYDGTMTKYHDRAPARLLEHRARIGTRDEIVASHEQRLAQQGATMSPPDCSRIFGWKRQMLEHERAAYEAVAGSLLASLGYPLR